MSQPILTVENLIKSFGNFRAVDGVSLSLNQGDNLAIIGESGSGKSTLARMIIGLVKTDCGQIIVNRAKVGMVFQDPYSSLDPFWNVFSILSEAFIRNPINHQERKAKMVEIINAVGLEEEMLSRFPHEFSGGQRQRLAIARTLLTAPELLILDEAVSSLDQEVASQIIDLLRRLKQQFNLTYIFISHNLKLVKDFSDTIAVMKQGQIVELSSTKDLFSNPKHSYTQRLLKAAFEFAL